MRTLPYSLNHSLTRLCSAALPSIQRTRYFFLSFDLSISLSAARGLRSILRNGAPRLFYRRRGRDGRVIVIAIIIITVIACDLPCL